MTNDIEQGCQSNLEWYYATDGRRFGPVPEDHIIELIKQKKIIEESLVWNKSMQDWQSVLSSKFADLARDPNAPPPLPGVAVSNTIVWVLAFAPLIGSFLVDFFCGMMEVSQDSFWVGFITFLVLNSLLAYADEKKLRDAGHDTYKFIGGRWLVILVPVYLFKRAKYLKHNYAYFIVWCVMLVIA